ncbi:MAG: MotA/TolQ/ExbB proton channel family protein [Candidatus Hydrogenedentes bacterium]|nr:MotA/TolQ/ExbB proton channel family protein [Candidatus Hydrogenedentota bacterium]
MRWSLLCGPLLFIVVCALIVPAFSQEPAPAPAAEAPAASPAPQTPPAPEQAAAVGSVPGPLAKLTLWEMMKRGGPIMIIIYALSVITVILALYFLLTVTPGREVPSNFTKRIHAAVRGGDLRSAYQMCEGRDEFIANVMRAGLKMSGHDRYVIQDAMESEGERGATALWQKISYLNNIGIIAPLLGLLGTVTGMIQAFGAIALDSSQVKGLTMAYGVAQAMITTAGGLILAIPTLVVYYYLRGRVIKIIAEVEAQASEIVELLSRSRSA